MKITFGSDLLVQFFFPGNNSPMSDCVERLDRTAATIIPASENFIECVFLSAGPDTKKSGIRIILVNHGMGRSLDEKSVERWRKWVAEKKIGVVLHNYPGYGKTPGPVTVERIIEDQRVLIRNLLDKHEPSEIAVLANSVGTSESLLYIVFRSLDDQTDKVYIGCGPTMAIADEFDFGMVILVSPYMSCCSFRGSSNWRSLVFWCFRGSLFDSFNCHKLVHWERLRQQRILIICGEIDKTIDPVNSVVSCSINQDFRCLH